MATTPNYGWVTPAPTDLVTDLPADFETFADAVDADLAGLLGGTTGQVLKKTSNLDHAFAFGTDPTTDVVTTAGDLIYGTGADAVTRLGIGTANQLLRVNSGATAPEWATISSGGMTEIASGSLTGATVTLSSIVTTYKDLVLVLRDYYPNTQGNSRIRVNGITTSTYDVFYVYSASNFRNVNAGSTGEFTLNVDAQDENNFTVINFPDYANTTSQKVWNFTSKYFSNSVQDKAFGMNSQRGTAAITEISITAGAAGTWSGGTYVLYGVS